jgi:hypothetical protein
VTPEEILVRAAELVEQGWMQGHFHGPHGEVCLSAAIQQALGQCDKALRWRFGEMIQNAVVTEVNAESLVDWNDAPGRTAEEVATALRNAKRWL